MARFAILRGAAWLMGVEGLAGILELEATAEITVGPLFLVALALAVVVVAEEQAVAPLNSVMAVALVFLDRELAGLLTAAMVQFVEEERHMVAVAAVLHGALLLAALSA